MQIPNIKTIFTVNIYSDVKSWSITIYNNLQ